MEVRWALDRSAIQRRGQGNSSCRSGRTKPRMLPPPQTASCSLWQAIPTVRVDVTSARKEHRSMVKHGWQVHVMVLTLVAAWALAPLGPHAEAQVSTYDLLGFGREIAGVYVVSRPPEAGASRLLTLSADGILSRAC